VNKKNKKLSKKRRFPGEVIAFEEEFLPGIPLKEKIEEKEPPLISPPAKSEVEETREYLLQSPESFIKKLTVSIILDRRIPEKLVKKIKKVVETIARVTPARGDEIIIERVPFIHSQVNSPSSPPSLLQDEFVQYIIKRTFSWLLILLLIVITFIFARSFITRLALASHPPKQETLRVEKTSSAPSKESPEAEKKKALEKEEKKVKEEKRKPGPFSFVTLENVDHLYFLIKDETPEHIAMIISYLEKETKEVASRLLSLFPFKKQDEIILKLSQESVISPEELNKLASSIKRRIDFLVGGIEEVVEVLNYADKETEKNILSFLDKEKPTLAQAVRRALFVFEDIKKLSSRALRVVLDEVEHRDLALALKNGPEELKKHILDNLSPGAREILEEEIAYLPPQPQEKVWEKQQEIARRVRKLKKEGKIYFSPEENK
jgi:flagellar motor switch protein FliG